MSVCVNIYVITVFIDFNGALSVHRSKDHSFYFCSSILTIVLPSASSYIFFFCVLSPFRWALFAVVDHNLVGRFRCSCCCMVSLLNGIGWRWFGLTQKPQSNVLSCTRAIIKHMHNVSQLSLCRDHRSISISFGFYGQSELWFLCECIVVILKRFIHKCSTNIYLWLS